MHTYSCLGGGCGVGSKFLGAINERVRRREGGEV